jgi:hypothetical protein
MENKILNIINIFKEKTISGDAVWTRTSSDNEFKIQFANATITTDNWFVDNKMCFDFVILNQNGDTIERLSITDEDFLNSDYALLSSFYETVKNSYYKVDETIDSIIKELNTSKKIGNQNN